MMLSNGKLKEIEERVSNADAARIYAAVDHCSTTTISDDYFVEHAVDDVWLLLDEVRAYRQAHGRNDEPKVPQPPQVDWSAAPVFALWWAADEDGESTWFECEPVIAKDDSGGYWDNPHRAATRRYARWGLGGFDWRQTLQKRPQPQP